MTFQLQLSFVANFGFQRTQRVRNVTGIVFVQPVRKNGCATVLACTLYNILDHFHQTQAHAVIGMINTIDTVCLQGLYFIQRDGAPTAAENLDVLRTTFLEFINHETKIFVMTTLVGRYRNGIGIFLDRSAHDIQHTAIVAQMNDFTTLCLDQSTHDVDGGVMSIKK